MDDKGLPATRPADPNVGGDTAHEARYQQRQNRRDALHAAIKFHERHGFMSDEGNRQATVAKTAGIFESYLAKGADA